MIKCDTCSLEKELTGFYKDRTRKHGYKTICKACFEINRKFRVQNNHFEAPKEGKLTCNTCSNLKDITCFDKNKRNPSGLCHKCKECRKEDSKKRYSKFRNEIRSRTHDYYHNNKEKVIASRREYNKFKRQTDPSFKLARNLRNRLYYALKRTTWKKNTKFYQYIGCSKDELKAHLEAQFQPGMTWDNYGDWHVDHIIPLSSAQTEEEIYKLCHYSNLQPLWAKDNIRKGDKIK